MASVLDAFGDTFGSRFSIPVLLILTLPVYYCVSFFLVGKMDLFYIVSAVTCVLLFSVMTNGILQHSLKKAGFITLNPISLIVSLLKSLLVLIPQTVIFGGIAWGLITYIQIPFDIPNINLIYNVVVLVFMGALIFTSYLLAISTNKIILGFNYKIIFTSFTEVIVSLLFFIPQMAVVTAVMVGPMWLIFDIMEYPLTHWGFIAYCSFVLVVDVYLSASCLSQISHTSLKLPDRFYDVNFDIL